MLIERENILWIGSIKNGKFKFSLIFFFLHCTSTHFEDFFISIQVVTKGTNITWGCIAQLTNCICTPNWVTWLHLKSTHPMWKILEKYRRGGCVNFQIHLSYMWFLDYVYHRSQHFICKCQMSLSTKNLYSLCEIFHRGCLEFKWSCPLIYQ